MKYWEKFYECACNSEGIMISYEHEDDEFKQLDMAFFNNGFNGKQLGFKERLRWAWHILRKGLPWIDCVILDKKTAKELGKDLLKWGNNE